MKDISVVVPLFNEEESLPELVKWITRVMNEHGFSYEIILVDDGSKDQSWQVVTALKQDYEHLIGIKFRRNYGKSAALNTGFKKALGNVVITMDADLQDSPDEIPALYQLITNEGFDLISGWKKKRYDPISKTIPTKLFNWATRKMSGIYLHDFNCGLKAYKNEVIKEVEVHGEMHRYIPVLAKWAGFTKIGEKVVAHQARKYGVTKFGFERFINGFLDLVTITFVTRFGKKPMHLFGFLGSIMFLVGFLISAGMGIDKLYRISMEMEARLITDQPLFFIALTTMILGTQLFLAGFIGEQLARFNVDKNIYHVSEIIE